RPIWMLDAAQKFRAIGMERFGLPMIVAKYRNGTDGDDNQRPVMEAAGKNAQALGYVVVPDGSDITALDMAARGTSDYAAAVKDLQQEIFLAIAGAFLQSLEGQTKDGAG